MYFLGIDPGVSGGFALLDSEGEVVHDQEYGKLLVGMHKTEHDVWFFLNSLSKRYSPITTYLELVTGYVGNKKQAMSRMFTFGRNYGLLRGLLIANRLKFHTVHPTKWQTWNGIRKKSGEDKGKWKNRLKAKAQELFPMVASDITLNTADALLIAYFGYMSFSKEKNNAEDD